jgi:hypothetical protein
VVVVSLLRAICGGGCGQSGLFVGRTGQLGRPRAINSKAQLFAHRSPHTLHCANVVIFGKYLHGLVWRLQAQKSQSRNAKLRSLALHPNCSFILSTVVVTVALAVTIAVTIDK